MTASTDRLVPIEAELAKINERVWDINVPLPLPRTQAKHGDVGNDWFIERNGDQWDVVTFDDEVWQETGRTTYADDDALMYALVEMTLHPTATGELKARIMGWVSPEWGARAEAEAGSGGG